MTMTPEERKDYLGTLGWPADVGWLPLASEIDEANLVLQLQRVAAAVRTLHDLPAGS